MVPFQRAYLMIFILIFLILAGNTAFVSISDTFFYAGTDGASFYSLYCK